MQMQDIIAFMRDNRVKRIDIEMQQDNQSITTGLSVPEFVPISLPPASTVSSSGLVGDLMPEEPKLAAKVTTAVEQKPEPKPKAKSEPKPAVKKTEEQKPAPSAKSVFDQFIDITTKDRGLPDAAQIRNDLIARMSRDELLRVNVEFSGGLDTDVPDNELREAIAGLFNPTGRE